MRFPSCSPFLVALLGTFAAGLVSAQQSGPEVFKANARIVSVDVVVSGKNRRPLTGLRQQDFVLLEDGHPQKIATFEEHSAASPASATPSTPATHDPGVFTNAPLLPPTDSVTVLVLDSLNTPLEDQSNLRVQVRRYINKQSAQGTRRSMAIFTLTNQLQLVQGFTDDPALLVAALSGRGTGLQNSALRDSKEEKAAELEVESAQLYFGEVLQAKQMQQFMAGQDTIRSSARVQRTLAALQQLARYLAGFHGRKNVVWFTGSFPVVIMPNPDINDAFEVQNDNQALLHNTDALLAAAQIAIYPVSAEGIATDTFTANEDSRLITRTQITRPGEEGVAKRGADQSAMNQIAQDTGGIAQYGTNSLAEALDRANAHGSNFYTLTYTSTNQATDGRFRKIDVRLGTPGYQLAYRRGYYADNGPPTPVKADRDYLSPYLRPGLPDSSQVPFALHMTHSAASGPAPAGDNPNLKGQLTRYKVDFLIPARSLQYEMNAAGAHVVHVESGLVVYNEKGEPLNYILRRVNLNLDADRYAKAQTAGVNLYLEIDAPESAATLRGGIYDLNAQLSGTLQIPLLAPVR